MAEIKQEASQRAVAEGRAFSAANAVSPFKVTSPDLALDLASGLALGLGLAP